MTIFQNQTFQPQRRPSIASQLMRRRAKQPAGNLSALPSILCIASRFGCHPRLAVPLSRFKRHKTVVILTSHGPRPFRFTFSCFQCFVPLNSFPCFPDSRYCFLFCSVFPFSSHDKGARAASILLHPGFCLFFTNLSAALDPGRSRPSQRWNGNRNQKGKLTEHKSVGA